jgi:hypothetical protein
MVGESESEGGEGERYIERVVGRRKKACVCV